MYRQISNRTRRVALVTRRATALAAATLVVVLGASVGADAHPKKGTTDPTTSTPIGTCIQFQHVQYDEHGNVVENADCARTTDEDHGFHPMPPDAAWAVGATLVRADNGHPVAGTRVDFYTSGGDGICFGRTNDDGDVHCDATEDLAAITAGDGFWVVFEGDAAHAGSEIWYDLEVQP